MHSIAEVMRSRCTMTSVARFGSSAELPLLESVAAALIDKGAPLPLLGHDEEAIAVYDHVIARVLRECSGASAARSGGQRAGRQGGHFGQLGRTQQGIALYDDVIVRFGSATEPALREQVAKALFNTSITLGVARPERRRARSLRRQWHCSLRERSRAVYTRNSRPRRSKQQKVKVPAVWSCLSRAAWL